jgi:hypothetical protein
MLHSQAAEYKKFTDVFWPYSNSASSPSEQNNLFWQIAFQWNVKLCGPIVGRSLSSASHLESQVRSQISTCRICGGQNGFGRGFAPSTAVFCRQFHSTKAASQCYSQQKDKQWKLGKPSDTATLLRISEKHWTAMHCPCCKNEDG